MVDVFSNDETMSLMLKKFDKTFEELTDVERQIIIFAAFDCSIGRYSKFRMWDREKIEKFLQYCEDKDMDYFECSDAERWALEDSFDC